MMKVTFTGEADALNTLASGSGVAVAAVPRAHAPSRFADYLELTKPRIAVMALFTVGAGYLLGAGAASESGRCRESLAPSSVATMRPAWCCR